VPPASPQPNKECYACPDGNRFMKHVDTRTERLKQIGAEEFEHIAVF
jgi:hypothetical protein